MDRTYISMLSDAYENYMKDVAESQVLRIDTSNIDFVRNPEDLKRVFERIEAIL
jgi:deoxyguanosine kinase